MAKKKMPDINWIVAGIRKNSAVWLNVGWYKYESLKNEYKRIGGHWVTLVGYDFNRKKMLVIHDPAPRAGNDFSNEYVEINEIISGRLVGNKKGLPTSAKGFTHLGKGMHMKKRAKVAIID